MPFNLRGAAVGKSAVPASMSPESGAAEDVAVIVGVAGDHHVDVLVAVGRGWTRGCLDVAGIVSIGRRGKRFWKQGRAP